MSTTKDKHDSWLDIMYPGSWEEDNKVDEWVEVRSDGIHWHVEQQKMPKEISGKFIEPVVSKEQWKEEGRCPDCGELGPFIGFAMVCSKHGVY